MKNTVYHHVKAGKTVLSNPKQFAEYANSITTNIDILYVGDDDLLYDINEENVKAVPGTLKVRHVERKILEILQCCYSTHSPILPIYFFVNLPTVLVVLIMKLVMSQRDKGNQQCMLFQIRSLVLTMKPDFQLFLANGMLFSFMNGSTGLLEGCY